MYDHLAGRLRQLKIRQADLAHHWGISQTSVSQRFRGRVAWSIDEMYDLLRICDRRSCISTSLILDRPQQQRKEVS